MDDALHVRAAPAQPGSAPQLISVPTRPLSGTLRVKVLLVDFSDRPGVIPASQYEAMLFSKGSFAGGSMRDYYQEVSLGKVDITGSVHGWLRLPQTYSFYANGKSGLALTYPRNAQGMAEDAVRAALASGVSFEPTLDALGSGTVTALFIVHAGVGGEAQTTEVGRASNIWSHKWELNTPVQVGGGLQVSVYLTVPNDAKVGVCAHELGHLAFQWEDFYDPNYDDDGSEWDGSGRWDLMAGGSWNGNGARPAHPACLHKLQHHWIDVQDVTTSTRLVLEPFTKTSAKVVRVRSPEYRPGQYLLLENRKQTGFDADLPGQGLLVWRVDEAREMFKPDRPALLLLQADGRHDLERASDWNEGDAGDPFPGSALRAELDDQGDLSTTFPGANRAGVKLVNITRDAATGIVTLDVAFATTAPPADPGNVVTRSVMANLPIPDGLETGVQSEIVLAVDGVVRDIAVDVSIAHSYIGDLRVELVAPSGASAVLHDRTGGNADNIVTVYRATELPVLRALIGERLAGSWRLRATDFALHDVGTLQKWGLSIAVGQVTGTISRRNETHLPIPDKDAAGIASQIDISNAGRVRSIAVQVAIAHPYVGDLRVELVGPTGVSALLQNQAGGNASDLRRTFTSSDTAVLAALIGSEVQGHWSLRVADLASRDTGTLESWGLEIALTSVAQSIEASAAPRLAIPDNAPAGIGNAIALAATGTVQGLELQCRIEHPYIGDLRVELIAPQGQTALLHDRVGGRTKDLSLNLSSSSNVALAAMVGQPLSGNWVLRVADLASSDVGVLTAWSLKATYS
jgi:immune inhibitor A